MTVADRVCAFVNSAILSSILVIGVEVLFLRGYEQVSWGIAIVMATLIATSLMNGEMTIDARDHSSKLIRRADDIYDRGVTAAASTLQATRARCTSKRFIDQERSRIAARPVACRRTSPSPIP